MFFHKFSVKIFLKNTKTTLFFLENALKDNIAEHVNDKIFLQKHNTL